MSTTATRQPGSAAGRISPSNEIKQRTPFPLSRWKLRNYSVNFSFFFSVHKTLINKRSSSVRGAVFTSRLRLFNKEYLTT